MLKEIREHYGIPQSLFADFLGISRSQLSMAESGRRSVPSTALLELLPLYKAIAQPASKSNRKDEKLAKELNTQKGNLNKLINRQLKENEYKLYYLEKRLSKMKDDQSRCIQVLAQIPSLKTASKQRHAGLLDIIEASARILQSETAEHLQLKLELQILHLKNEISYLENRGR